MPRNSIRSRRGRRKLIKHFELQLTSMMDVLTIILVFLLKSYATSFNNFASVKGIQLPMSGSPDNPPDSLQVIVTPEAITFEGNHVVEFVQTAANVGSSDANYTLKDTDLDPKERNLRILPLFAALTEAKEKSEILRTKSQARDAEGKPLPFDSIWPLGRISACGTRRCARSCILRRRRDIRRFGSWR